MYFTSDDGYQNVFVFDSMPCPLKLDSNNKIHDINKNKPSHPSNEPILSNLANGRVSIKFKLIFFRAKRFFFIVV